MQLTSHGTRSLNGPFSRIWQDSLVYPAYGAGFSLLVLLANVLRDRFKTQKSSGEFQSETLVSPDNAQSFSSTRRRVEAIGGLAIFAYRVLQLLGILSLLGISIAQFVLDVCRDSLAVPRTLQAIQVAIYVCPRTRGHDLKLITLCRCILLCSVFCRSSPQVRLAVKHMSMFHCCCFCCGPSTCTATSGL